MRVMPVKVIWDYAFYWAFFAFLWFNRKLADVDVMRRARPQVERAAALNRVFATLTREVLQHLNARIAVGGEDARAVAADYLKSRGLLQ